LRKIEAKQLPTDEDPREWLKKILTKQELKHIKFKYFRAGALGLTVDSSTWHYNLNLKKARLVEGLRDYCKEVKDLRFTIGEV
jgi:hypothetical protein